MLNIKKISIIATCFIIILSCKINANPIFVNSLHKDFKENGYKVTFYIGLNDREKYVQLISSDDAENILQNILLKYIEGFTILKSKGVWHDGKQITFENGFIIIVYFDISDREFLEEYASFISEEITEKLNQSSVLVEFTPINSKFIDHK